MECTIQITLAVLLGCVAAQLASGADLKYTCEIKKDSGVEAKALEGTVKFTQADSGGKVSITVDVSGFEAADNASEHGFHVHAEGKTTGQCGDAKGHFNPEAKEHGGPKDTIRHVGDLGNVKVGADGSIKTTFDDSVISLSGDNSIVGKAIVIHADKDDLGAGGHQDSKTTGNAGVRLACCVIVEDEASAAPSLPGSQPLLLVTLLSLFYCLIRL